MFTRDIYSVVLANLYEQTSKAAYMVRDAAGSRDTENMRIELDSAVAAVKQVLHNLEHLQTELKKAGENP